MGNIKDRIADDVKKNRVMLYVKGNKQMPMCGFSKAVMDVFNELGVEYETADVLQDPELREGVKMFTNWPTIPQIFVNGQFVGGCDIIRDMYQSGELQKLLNVK